MEYYLWLGAPDERVRELNNDDVSWYFARPGELAALNRWLTPLRGQAKRARLHTGTKQRKLTVHQVPRPTDYREFAAAYLAEMPTDADLAVALKKLNAYAIVCAPELMAAPKTPAQEEFWVRKQVHAITDPLTDPVAIARWVHARLFAPQIGTKMDSASFAVSPRFNGEVTYRGNLEVTLNGDYGSDFTAVGTYKWGLYHDPDKMLELWPEFTHDDGVEIELVVYATAAGNADGIDMVQTFSEADLAKPARITPPAGVSLDRGAANVVIRAKGSGQLTIGGCHYRWSRVDQGAFLPGGQRIVDDDRREVIVYFNPGDLKPPLNVYFSGYRTAEGFEAFYLMRSFGSPFILVGDPRLEGGAFYLGSPKIENGVKNFIQDKLDLLGFSNDQLICSGMSMGSFGATFYGSQLSAHAVIVTKPLFNLGTMADNEQALRYGGFATSLDILNYHAPQSRPGQPVQERIEGLNDRFWRAIRESDLNHTKYFLVYMLNDDYDHTSYSRLIREIGASGQHPYVIGHGLPGHHVDNSAEAVGWFKKQYLDVLKEDFQRVKK